MLTRALRRIQVLESERRASHEPVAVIGIGCRLPGGIDGPRGYWELLSSGRDVIVDVPETRWPRTGSGDDRAIRRAALLSAPLDEMDVEFAGIAPREAAVMDPQQRLVLEVAWEALEDAALPPARAVRTGVFLGVSWQEYQRTITPDGARSVDAHTLTGTMPSILAGRVAHQLGLRGPAVALDTACSSSLVAVHQAINSLRAGECETALAGGVNLLQSELTSAALARMGALSPDGHCRPFDARANGYVRGEGAGIIVLKRLSRAIADGDEIRAVLRGSAVNHDGRSMGLTAPNPVAQRELLRAALTDSGCDAAELDYVETHGTGTPLGDPIEIEALAEVFGAVRADGTRCLLGSVKSRIGHLEAAAGIAGLIKVVLQLQYGRIPRQYGFETLNPKIALDGTALRVPTEDVEWASSQRPRVAGVSSFGFAGTNAHVVVAAAPDPPVRVVSENPALLVLSARTSTALDVLTERYVSELSDSNLPVADIAATAALGRTHFGHRRAVVARTAAEAAQLLRASRAGSAASAQPRVAMLFTGQGAQYSGMGSAWYQRYSAFRAAVDECDELLGALPGGWRVRSLLCEADDAVLARTEYAQPALFAFELACARLWAACGIRPDVVLGHSLGELVAATVAGALTVAEGLRIAAVRGRMMQVAPRPGALAAVFGDPAEFADVLDELAPTLGVAAVNTPGQFVVSGAEDSVRRFREVAQRREIRAVALPGATAFHSPLLDPVLDEFTAAVGELAPGARTASIPLISNVIGAFGGPLDADYWRAHARGTVRFAEGLRTLAEFGIDAAIEVGPHPVLLEFGRQAGISARWVPSLRRSVTDDSVLLSGVGEMYCAGADIEWSALIPSGARRRNGLPTYPFERERLAVPGAATVQLFAEAPAKSTAYLGEHRYRGTPVVPGAYLALSALRAAGGFARELVDFVLTRPVPLDELREPIAERVGDRVDIRLVVGSDTAAAVMASVVPQTDGAAGPDDLTEALRTHSVYTDTDDFYRRCAVGGLTFGPRFRWITELRAGTDTLLARLSRPGELSGAAEAATVCMVDAAIQTGLALVTAGGPVNRLPAGIGRLRLHRTESVAAAWVLAVRTGATVRVTIFDTEDARICEVEDLWFGRTDAEATVPIRVQDWREAPASTAGRGPAAWLVIGGLPAADRLAAALRAAGDDAVAVETNAAVAAVRGSGTSGGLGVAGAFGMSAASGLSGASARAVVYLSSFDAGDDAGAAAVETESALKVVRALAETVDAGPLYLVTGGAVGVLDDERVRPAAAALCGLAAVVRTEVPELGCRLVDLPARANVADRRLVGELRSGATDPVVALRGKRRYVPELTAPATQETAELDGAGTYLVTGGLGALGSAAAQATVELDGAGAYLVTGGLGALGSATARVLAQAGAGTLVLAGRHEPDARATAVIREITALGTRVETVRLDVADRVALSALFARFGADLPRLAGVVHCAGVLDDALLVDQGADRVRRVFTGKASGAWHLHELTADLDLSVFVLFSSASALVGTAGQANYAAANAYLDGLARMRSANGLAALSIQWGPWSGTGMAAGLGDTARRAWERHGVAELAVDAGLRALRALLGASGVVAVFPTAAGGLVDTAAAGQGGAVVGDGLLGGLALGGSAVDGLAVDGSVAGGVEVGGGPLNAAAGAVRAGAGSLGGVALGRAEVNGLAVDGSVAGGVEVGGGAINAAAAGSRAVGGPTAAGGSAVGDAAASGAASEGVGIGDSAVDGAALDEILPVVRALAAKALGRTAPVADGVPLRELGLDSMLAVELRNSLAADLGVRLPATLLFDHPTVAGVAAAIVRLRPGAAAKVNSGAAPRKAVAHNATEHRSQQGSDDAIAIIGMGCRYPGGVRGPADLWRLLIAETDAVTEVPAERWDVDAYFDADPDAEGKTYTRWGGFVDGVRDFDAGFFDISVGEARMLDPQQRLLLETSWEALEQAGYPAQRLAGSRTGVFVGIMSNDYAERMARADLPPNAWFGTGNLASVASGRLSYFLGLNGPSLTVDTACSSSLVTVHLAVQSLRRGECDLALAAGATVVLTPSLDIYFARARGLAADGRCKSFDARADGVVWSDGAGTLVLKRLSEARRDGDRVLGLIRGTAVNSDGRSQGLSAPSGPAQEQVIRSALVDAGLRPEDIDYVEAHGTGTALGDPIEVNALARVLATERTAERPLWIGSVKSNLGHTQAAAGIANIIKVVESMRHGRIPASLHYRSGNPHLDWDEIGVRVVAAERAWPRGDRPRRAGVSAFGISGTNAHVLLEEAPEADAPGRDQSGPHLLALSAKSAAALRELAARYAERVGAQDNSGLRDLCASANVGRTHFAERVAIVFDTAPQLSVALGRVAAGDVESGAVVNSAAAPTLIETAERYLGGGEIDWAALYPRDSWRPVELPTYPFQRKRHWLELPARSEIRHTLPIGPTMFSGHELQGMPTVPAAWLISRAARLAAELPGARSWLVAGLRLLEPIAVRADGALRVRLTVDGDGYSVEFGDGATVYARAALRAAADSPEVAAPAATVADGESWREYYDRLSGHGLRLGADYRCGVAAARITATESETLLRTAADGAEAILLDGCLHSLVLAADGPNRLYLPVAIDRAQLFGSEIVGGATVRCRVRITERSDRVIVGDVTMIDESERVLAVLTGVCLVAADTGPGDAPVSGAESDRRVDRLLHHISWEPTEFGREYAGVQRWVVFADGPVGTAVAAGLAARAEVVVVRPDDVSDESPVGGDQPPGIVYAWTDEPARVRIAGALRLIRMLVETGWRGAPLYVITLGAQAVSSSDRPDPDQALLWGLGRTLATEHPELASRLVDLEAGAPIDGTFVAAGISGGFGARELAVRDGRWLAARLADGLPADTANYRLLADRSGALELMRNEPAERVAPGPGEVEIAVAATGLNRRDIWLALGTHPESPAPLGAECAGRISAVGPDVTGLAVGDRVVALAEGSFARYVTVDRRLVAPLPGRLSFAEGATLPVAFASAWYGLFDIGGLRSGQRVLVHARADEIGMATVQLARHAGAVLFAPPALCRWAATAGIDVTELPTAVAAWAVDGVRRHTGGAGMDVVVDALAGNLTENAPGILADGGRFVNLADPTQISAGHDADRPIDPAFIDRERLGEILRTVLTLFERGALAPPPHTPWPGAAAAAAFDAMRRYDVAARPVLLTEAAPAPQFDADGTYLVTGGFGGLGGAAARWLVDRGARSLALVSRRGPDTGGDRLVESLRAQGVRVSEHRADVADRAAVAALLSDIAESGPLRGVIHCAGVLDDGVLTEQTPSRFETVLGPKYIAAQHLDELTRGLSLELFVVYSSVAGVLGTPGQANYAAANAALDALVARRRADGLPGLSIAWGPFGDVGMAAGRPELTAYLDRRGLPALRVTDAVAALDRLVPLGVATAGVFDFAEQRWYRAGSAENTTKDHSSASVSLSDTRVTPDEPVVSGTTMGNGVAGQEHSTNDRAVEDTAPWEELVQRVAMRVLDRTAPLDPEQPLHDSGVDSLTGMELRTALIAESGTPLPVSLVFDYPTVRDIAKLLRRKGVEVTVPVANSPVVPSVRPEPWVRAVTPVPSSVSRELQGRAVMPVASSGSLTAKVRAVTPVPPSGSAEPQSRAVTSVASSVLPEPEGRAVTPVQSSVSPEPQDQANTPVASSVLPPLRVRAEPEDADDPIVIVGMACRFPGGVRTPEEFWELLWSGRDAISEVPPQRWDVDAFYDPDPAALGRMYSRWGGFVDGVDEFDAAFFGIGDAEARAMDPQQRLLLEASWEALERSGRAPGELAGSRTGVYVGLCFSEYPGTPTLTTDPTAIGAYSVLGAAPSVAAGRVAYALGLQGPAVTLDTACSSSLVALQSAEDGLRAGRCDLALVGGVNLQLAPETTIGFSRLSALSPDGRVRAFAADANGYVRADGCGVLVLERLSAARRNGDRVLAVVRGVAVNHDGRSNGLTAPNGPAQQRVIGDALTRAGIRPTDVDYVETHGTGTPLGDPIEAAALAEVYCAGRQTPLLIGSVKTNIGHAEAAAGVAGVMKAVLMLRHGKIPPSLHFDAPSPHIDWARTSLEVVRTGRTWPQTGRARVVGVSSFGMSGTNAHVILARGDAEPVRAVRESGPQVLPLSARDTAALAAAAGRWADELDSAHTDFGDLAYTAAAGRSHFEERIAVVAPNAGDAARQLRAIAADPAARTRVERSATPKVGLLFTGQGSQYPGMARDLFDTEPVFRRALAECDALLGPIADGIGLIDALYGARADAELLHRTIFTQPALFAVEWALWELWRDRGITPAAVLGHSVGEYVAACAAGALSMTDGLRLVAARGRMMQRLPDGGGMLAVDAGADSVEPLLARYVSVVVAGSNGPAQIVVAGPDTELERLRIELADTGIRAVPLPVSHAFHSPLMEPILGDLAAAARGIAFTEPRIPLISNLTGAPVVPGELSAEYWARHARQPVRFAEGLRALAGLGIGTFLEIGPQPVLSGLGRRTIETGARFVATLRRGHDDRETMAGALAELYTAGVRVNWERVHGPHGRRRVLAPTYPFQRKRFWIERAERATDSDAAVRTDSAAREFTETLGPGTPAYLADHVVGDAVTVPAAWYVSTIAAMSRRVHPATHVTIEDLVIATPLLLTGTHRVGIRFEARPDGFAVTVSDGGDQPNVRGRISKGESIIRSADDLDLSAALRRCHGWIPGPEFYQRLAAVGLRYGPAFQRVVDVRTGEREAVVTLSDPDTETGAEMPHPVLLDAAFQATIAAIPAESADATWVPVAIDRAVVPTGRISARYGHVRVVTSTPQVFVADVRLLDEKGDPVLIAAGLRIMRTAAERRDRGEPDVGAHQHLYEIAWRAAAPARPGVAGGRWLVIGTAGGPADAIAARLRTAGADCVLARPGRKFGAVADGFEVDLSSPADTRELLGTLNGLRGIVYAAALSEDSAAVPDRSIREVVAALHLVQSAAGADLWLLTRDAQAVCPVDRVAPDQAALWGFARAAQRELSENGCRIIDLDDQAIRNPDGLVAAMLDGDTPRQLALRAGDRLVPRLVAARSRRAGRDADAIAAMKSGTVLIVGGLGGIGLALARRLVERGARRLVLAGRSAPSRAAADTIQELRRRGVHVETVALDVTDRAAVAATLDRIDRELSPLAGVVHLAGVIDDGSVLEQTATRTGAVLAPKAHGAWYLHELTTARSPRFFVLFSSAAGVLGQPGQSNYAAANAFLDGLAESRRAAGLPALSIAWGPWARTGMMDRLDERAVGHLARRGYGLLTTDQALDILDRTLESGFDGAVVGVALKLTSLSTPGADVPDVLHDMVAPGERQYISVIASGDANFESETIELVRRCVGLAPDADLDRPLHELGLDSVAAIEIRDELARRSGHRLPATLAFEYPTPRAIVGLLTKLGRAAGQQISTQDRPVREPNGQVVPGAANHGAGAAAAPPRPVAGGATVAAEPPRSAVGDIAIVGVSGRYPGARDLDEYWRVLIEGRDCITEIPRERWDQSRYFDPDRHHPYTAYTKWGGFLDDVDRFDPLFFAISPREAEILDPQERLFLQTAWAALEDAGHTRAGLARRGLRPEEAGVFVGVMWGTYQMFGAEEARLGRATLPGSTFWSIANRVSHVLDFQGPSMAIDTACSSSLTALHLACQSLRTGECRLAVVGGVNLSLHPYKFVALSQGQFASSDGRCRSFGAGGDGYVAGEGVGALVLRPLADAEADGDTIHAVIKGTAVNHGGRVNGFTVPNPNVQAAVIRSALRTGGVDPGTISYVEAHGTGTALGDPIEINGLAKVFGDTELTELPIGSVKSNVGHLEAAAGVAALTKVLLQLRHETIVASLHADPPNPNIDFGATPFRIPDRPLPWPSGGADRRRRAAISSFGAGGSNANVVVEEYIDRRPVSEWSGAQVVPVSARDTQRLAEYVGALDRHLADHEPNLADLAYTMQVGRQAGGSRTVFVARDLTELRAAVRAWVPEATISVTDSRVADWLGGADIDWEAVRGSGTRRRIPLPTYPFARERYWIPDVPEQIGSDEKRAVVAAPAPAEPDIRALVPVWRAAAAPAGEFPVRRALFVYDAGTPKPLVHALFAAVGDPGRMVRVTDGDRPDGLGRTDFGAGAELGRAMLARFPDTECVVDVCDLKRVGMGDVAAADLGRIGFYQGVIDARGAGLVLLHVSAGHPGSDGPEFAPLGGLAAGLAAEIGQVRTRGIELAEERAAVTAERLLAILGTEYAATDGAPRVRYRAGVRERIELSATTPAGGLTVDPTRTYVVTGGTRGLGAEFAAALAARGARRLVIMGREPLPPEETWDRLAASDRPDAVKVRRLLALRADGVAVRTYSGELTDVAALDRFFTEVRRELGPIGGVLHCAGAVSTESPAFVRKTGPGVAAVLAPKLAGTEALAAVLAADRPDFFVLFSSVSAVLPGLSVGLSDYAMANAHLDRFAEAQHAKGRTWFRSVNWPSFRDTGFGAADTAAYLATGLPTLTAADGIRLLDGILGISDAPVVLPYLGARLELSTRASFEPTTARPAPVPDDRVPVWAAESGHGANVAFRELLQIFSDELKLAPAKFEGHRRFEEYGADSVLIASAVRRIEEVVGEPFDPALVLEFPTLDALAGLLTDRYPARFGASSPEPDEFSGQKAGSVPYTAQYSSRGRGSGSGRTAEPIAVVGIGCRLPGGDGPDAFWRLLADGESGIREVDPARWDPSVYYHPSGGPGRTNSKWGGFVDGIDLFDPEYFGIGEALAWQLDPLQRLLLEVSAMATADAGYRRADLAGKRIGVYAGSRAANYVNRIPVADRNTIVGIGQNFIAARISDYFDWHAGNLVLDSACSSSLVSVHLACQALRGGELDAALAGGVEVLLDEMPFVTLAAAGVLSPNGRCATFSEHADGFVPGEGAALLMLKRLDDAVADGDRIYAVLRGSAIGNDGHTMGITTPNMHAQIEVITAALESAGMAPDALSYVEAHGTGTMIGDPIELKALATVLGDRGALEPCAVGSVKTNIGHLLSAAGIAGAVKAILAVHHGALPPSLHCAALNPRFAFTGSPLYVNRELRPWRPADGRPRAAGVSSFGFGGTNAHLIVEQAPTAHRPVRNPLSPPAFRKRSYMLPKTVTREAQPPQRLLVPAPAVPVPSFLRVEPLV